MTRMIFGVKCEGCKMWTRITEMDAFYKIQGPYYCDECNANVTYHTTKATINL